MTIDADTSFQVAVAIQGVSVIGIGWVIARINALEKKIIVCPNGRCCQSRYPTEMHMPNQQQERK